MLAEGVVDARIVQREFSRDPLFLVKVVGDAHVALDREMVEGIRVFEHRLDAGEELRCRPEHAGLLEHDAGVVVERGDAIAADAADRAVEAQLLRLPEQVAVPPVAFEPQPFGVRERAADAEKARLALAHLDVDRNIAVGVEAVALLHGHAVEDFQTKQAIAGIVDLLRRIFPAALEAGHVFREIAVDLVGALDGRVAITGHGPGGNGKRDVQRRGGVVGDDLAIRHLGKRPALFL